MTPENDVEFMLSAITEAEKSEPIESAYCVGAVLVRPTNDTAKPTIVATGFSRELPGNTHAEECCLLKLAGSEGTAKGCHMYTTMEPCGERLSGKLGCAQRIIEAGIVRVIIGVREPPNFIASCVGADLLRKAGITVDFLDRYEG
ncbi:DRAP deaminase [Blyttiomyces sp. JEL0837]|nr:DRAP deaminase [Blyttiomyces sp. JEL0837]